MRWISNKYKLLKNFVNNIDKIARGIEQLNTINSNGVKIDVDDVIQYLNTKQAKIKLQQFYGWNNRWNELLRERSIRAAKETYDFIENIEGSPTFVMMQFDFLKTFNQLEKLDGNILDLGVFTGWSTKQLANLYPQKTIYGFDSFEGLPENWSHALKGDFGNIVSLPEMPKNVMLIKGWFDETLPIWSSNHKDEVISILRIDCDIYSSTKTVFESLGSHIRSGTLIIFDEYFGYYDWKQHEHKAFIEFVEETKIKYRFLSYGLTYAMVEVL